MRQRGKKFVFAQVLVLQTGKQLLALIFVAFAVRDVGHGAVETGYPPLRADSVKAGPAVGQDPAQRAVWVEDAVFNGVWGWVV